MKKILILSLVAAFSFACGTPKTVQESNKVIKGYWTLDDISYDSAGTFNVTLFNDSSSECMEGSMWRFIPNNNTGNYTVENPSCSTGQRFFKFDIQQIDKATGLYDFTLKPTNEKYKSDDKSGFRLRLAQLTESSMIWEQTVTLEGKPFKINMHFSKSN